jgi:hypothetical protein
MTVNNGLGNIPKETSVVLFKVPNDGGNPRDRKSSIPEPRDLQSLKKPLTCTPRRSVRVIYLSIYGSTALFWAMAGFSDS